MKTISGYIEGTWMKDAVGKLYTILQAFEAKHIWFGDGFAEAVLVLTNWGDFNWRNTPVQTVQIGNPTDSWGCTVQNCLLVMAMGAVGFTLSEKEGNPNEFVIGMVTMNRPESPMGADLYCTNSRSIPKSLVWRAGDFETRLIGEITHHGRPLVDRG